MVGFLGTGPRAQEWGMGETQEGAKVYFGNHSLVGTPLWAINNPGGHFEQLYKWEVTTATEELQRGNIYLPAQFLIVRKAPTSITHMGWSAQGPREDPGQKREVSGPGPRTRESIARPCLREALCLGDLMQSSRRSAQLGWGGKWDVYKSRLGQ